MADHFAKRILEAVKDQLIADDVSCNVFRGRQTPLSTDIQQVPTVLVNSGPDIPVGERGFNLIGSFDSELSVIIEFYVRDSDPEALENELFELRKLTHISLMDSGRLSLPFVIDLYPSDASQPEYETEGQADVGKLTVTWNVEYRSNVNDPST